MNPHSPADPARRSAHLQSSGWQEGRMDEGHARLPGASMADAGDMAPWMTSAAAPGSETPTAGARPRHVNERGHDEDERGRHDDERAHFARFRAEYARQLDEDYETWCRECGQSDARQTLQHMAEVPPAPADEGPLKSLGRAISEVVTGTPPAGGVDLRDDMRGAGRGGSSTFATATKDGAGPSEGRPQAPDGGGRSDQGDKDPASPGGERGGVQVEPQRVEPDAPKRGRNERFFERS